MTADDEQFVRLSHSQQTSSSCLRCLTLAVIKNFATVALSWQHCTASVVTERRKRQNPEF